MIFVEPARQQSRVELNAEPRDHTWSQYFYREVLENGETKNTAPLRSFTQESFKELTSTVGREPLAPAILTLMSGMVDPLQLQSFLKATRNHDPVEVGYTGGNAATLVNRVTGKFSETDLPGANLVGADLRGCNLSNVNLKGAHLQEVDFTRANLNGADLSFTDLSETAVWQCSAENTKFEGARTPQNVILVFTGSWAMFLPRGATVLDAAFSIHSHIGRHSTGGIVDGEPSSLGRELPDRARVWIQTDRTQFTVTPEWPSLVKTTFVRHLVNKLIHRINDTPNLLIYELHKLDLKDKAPSYESDLDVYDDAHLQNFLLRAVIRIGDSYEEWFSHYKDILEGRTSQEDTIRQLKDTLDRYRQLRNDLIDGGVVTDSPRTVTRMFNLFTGLECFTLFKDYDVESNEELLIKVLRDELDSKQLVTKLAAHLKRKRLKWQKNKNA